METMTLKLCRGHLTLVMPDGCTDTTQPTSLVCVLCLGFVECEFGFYTRSTQEATKLFGTVIYKVID